MTAGSEQQQAERGGAEQRGAEKRSIRAVLQATIADARALVAAEASLARAEVARNFRGARGGLGRAFQGLVLLVMAFLLATVALVAALSGWLGLPFAALLVALCYAALGAWLFSAGKKAMRPERLWPDETFARLLACARRDARPAAGADADGKAGDGAGDRTGDGD